MHKLLAAVCLIAGCSKKEEPPKEVPKVEVKAPEPPPPEPKKEEGPPIPDECKLTGSGAVKFEQVSKGGRSAVNISYWWNEADKKKLTGLDGFAVFCKGDSISFSIVPGAKTNKDTAPFGPKKYTFVKGKSDISISAFVAQKPWEPTSGTIDITAFDSRHIAGTISLKGKLDKKKELDLEGSFDLKCAGSACTK